MYLGPQGSLDAWAENKMLTRQQGRGPGGTSGGQPHKKAAKDKKGPKV